ncbi:MAG: hypothetical protein EP343_33975 [Deltaproteobacteria bacterium]|nr:MAG: hypothetical protein EP343_33975 [Deltaproteobacteria bacterium]
MLFLSRVAFLCFVLVLTCGIQPVLAQSKATPKTASPKEEPAAPAKPAKKPKPWVLNHPDNPVWLSASVEAGFLAIIDHKIQLGQQGSVFDYIRDGGQDNLFLFLRLSADVTLFKQHTLVFLYQPFDIRSQTILREQLRQDMATFEQGDAVNFRYGFDFYRVSYVYDIFPAKDMELSFGLSLQIRNATIVFSNVSGTKRSYRNDIGPVPIIKTRGYFSLPHRVWIGFEIDGFYAPISILNGSDSEVVGAILDASVRVGYKIHPMMDLYLNIRYIGGGGVGTSTKPAEPGSDGFVENWLHTMSFSLGVALR